MVIAVNKMQEKLRKEKMFQMKSAHYLHNNNLHNEDGGKIEI